MTSTSSTASSLDTLPAQFADQPVDADTVELLRCVRDRDYTALATMCDDDFGIVDVDPAGAARVVRNRAHDTMGFSVLEFRQYLTIGDHTATFDCVTTIVWKHTPDGWREARWHGSVVSSVVPDGMLPDRPA